MSSIPSQTQAVPGRIAWRPEQEVSDHLDALDGVHLLTPPRFGDARGFFSETFNQRHLAQLGIAHDWVQDNHSLSEERGVTRGLHFQVPPYAQAKLIRVTRGAIFDVVVDLRPGSPTYLHHAWAILSAENWRQLYVPVGFAHGFCTLEAGTEVIYKVSAFYSRPHERAIRWDDPALGIPWPIDPAEAILSPKDEDAPYLAECALPDWM